MLYRAKAINLSEIRGPDRAEYAKVLRVMELTPSRIWCFIKSIAVIGWVRIGWEFRRLPPNIETQISRLLSWEG